MPGVWVHALGDNLFTVAAEYEDGTPAAGHPWNAEAGTVFWAEAEAADASAGASEEDEA